MAKLSLQLSCLDQENLRLKIEQWNQSDVENKHFFRPYLLKEQSEMTSINEDENKNRNHKDKAMFVGNGADGDASISDDNNFEQSLLWVYRSTWQKQLMARYGNTISLIDATY